MRLIRPKAGGWAGALHSHDFSSAWPFLRIPPSKRSISRCVVVTSVTGAGTPTTQRWSSTSHSSIADIPLCACKCAQGTTPRPQSASHGNVRTIRNKDPPGESITELHKLMIFAERGDSIKGSLLLLLALAAWSTHT